MKRAGRLLLRIALISAATLGALLLALQLFFQTRLTYLLDRTLVPRLHELYGVDISIADTHMNFLGGSMSVGEFAIANPQPFEEPHLLRVRNTDADLDVLALLRGVIQVAGSHVEEARMVVVHHKNNTVNLFALNKPERGAPAPSTAEETMGPAAKRTPVQLPRILLRDFTVESVLEYVDHYVSEQPLKLAFRLRVEADNVATFERTTPFWGTVAVNGHLDGDPDAFVTRLQASVAPLVDPERPSFDLRGSVAEIEGSQIDAALRQADMDCDRADMRVDVKCRNGTFVEPDSVIAITLRNVSLRGSLARRMKGFPIPRDLTVTAPIGGDISAPKIRRHDIWRQSLLDNLADNSEQILRAFNIDAESGEQLGKALKAIGDILLAAPEPK